MGIQIIGNGNTVAEVGGSVFRALHTHNKPLEYGALGHYRTNHRFAIVNAQAANSRLFVLRNNGSNLIIPTRIVVKLMTAAAHTAIIENSIDLYKLTGFTVLDTTNTVTPTVTVKRGATMAAAPGSAQVRGVTVAGVAAGMTGATSTKDGTSIGQAPIILPQAVMAVTETLPRTPQLIHDFLDDVNGTHPLVLANNEGFLIENRVLLGAAAGASVYLDVSWAEVAAF